MENLLRSYFMLFLLFRSASCSTSCFSPKESLFLTDASVWLVLIFIKFFQAILSPCFFFCTGHGLSTQFIGAVFLRVFASSSTFYSPSTQKRLL
uniref:Secreted protein n=1 Tax=Prolemur simus TaxID=1328070 RepID=A0A8C8YN73_PROSS